MTIRDRVGEAIRPIEVRCGGVREAATSVDADGSALDACRIERGDRKRVAVYINIVHEHASASSDSQRLVFSRAVSVRYGSGSIVYGRHIQRHQRRCAAAVPVADAVLERVE